jgi:hypothetical protein
MLLCWIRMMEATVGRARGLLTVRGNGRGSRTVALLAAPLLLLVAGGSVGAGEPAAAGSKGGARGTVPRLDEIVAELCRQEEQLQSLAVDYTLETEALGEPRVVRRLLAVEFLASEQKSFAFAHDRRWYSFRRPPRVALLAPDVEPDFNLIPGGADRRRERDAEAAKLPRPDAAPRRETRQIPALEAVYDGTRVLERTDSCVTIIDLARSAHVQNDYQFFNQEYLHLTGRALPDLSAKKMDRADDLLRVALTTGGFSVRRELQEENGRPCVVVERPGEEVLWLEPDMGFAVRRWELLDPKSGKLLRRISHRELTEAAPGLWLPTLSWQELCAPPLSPEPYAGKPLLRQVYRVKWLCANAVPDSMFVMSAEPGVEVHDWTKLPPRDGFDQPLRFLMPADPEALDEAVSEALGRGRGATRPGPTLASLGLSGAGLLAGVGLLLAAFRLPAWRVGRVASGG